MNGHPISGGNREGDRGVHPEPAPHGWALPTNGRRGGGGIYAADGGRHGRIALGGIGSYVQALLALEATPSNEDPTPDIHR